MMRRPGGADFAPGAHVFPGGSVHPEDRSLGDPIKGAAIRELFEELGILLANHVDGLTHGMAGEREAAQIRHRLARGVSFPAALREALLEPATAELTYFARWVTPEQLRRRFDTRFFLAQLPSGQTVHPQPGEVDHWLWTTPARALAAADFNMVFVTRNILQMLAAEPDAEALRRRYRNRRRIAVVRPKVRQVGDAFEVVIDSLPNPGRRRQASPAPQRREET